jgi:hypothetical protein
MAKAKIEDIRNLAFCGHGSTGKTTLVDQLLVKSGAASGTPSVDSGSSICDFDPEEKHHKYTIEAKLVHFDHKGKRFNVLDTPGYPDFIGQAIGALYGVDLAAIVINAHAAFRSTPAACSTRRAKRPGADDRHQQDGRTEHRLLRPGGEIRELWGPSACWSTCPSAAGRGSKAWQHAAPGQSPPARWSIRTRSTRR